MAMTGLLKGLVGIAVRPAVGIFELVNKGTHGMGLVCLGREAITGSMQRRVRAPGALADEQPEVTPPPSPPLRHTHTHPYFLPSGQECRGSHPPKSASRSGLRALCLACAWGIQCM